MCDMTIASSVRTSIHRLSSTDRARSRNRSDRVCPDRTRKLVHPDPALPPAPPLPRTVRFMTAPLPTQLTGQSSKCAQSLRTMIARQHRQLRRRWRSRNSAMRMSARHSTVRQQPSADSPRSLRRVQRRPPSHRAYSAAIDAKRLPAALIELAQCDRRSAIAAVRLCGSSACAAISGCSICKLLDR